ncbi:MAG TPA: superinfection immunity protein [Methylomirabilota bacterium]|nr:superinfection immunity protein [Methylomirabilota bacterium]
MSEEWLKKLAELSNDKQLMQRAKQMQKQSAGRSGGSSRPGGRSLFGAAFGFWFRFLFLFGLAEAATLFAFAGINGENDASWGDQLRYALWYVLKQQALPDDSYRIVEQVTGLAPSILGDFYDSMRPALDAYRDQLVFALPVGLALALTFYFLPSINAARRQNPIRMLVYLLNLAAAPLYLKFTGAPVLWLGALILSFAGRGGLRLPKPAPRPTTVPTSQPSRPAKGRPVRVEAARAEAAAGGPAHAARAVVALKREPTVTRRGGGSWVRPR